ncbi:MAG: cysteine hydrolase [Candidatus Bathyarchaeota archaeon]|nr:cysteine hydrolase [Candidatus Termiticorpusculum sp.]
MIRPVVILVDMLNDFVTGKLQTKRAKSIVTPLQQLVVSARENGVPVIFSNDAHYPQDSEVTQKWGQHAMKGTYGAEVISELAPDLTMDFIVEKRTYSGFYETGLDSLLRDLYKGEGVKTVILGGLHTHMCVRHTAADAFFRGYRIIVVKNGVNAFTSQAHKQGIAYLENVYGAKVLTVNEIIKTFK